MSDTRTPLVSIITPCYNGVLYLSQFLESILHQSYTNIEFILVNDGSTDGTEEVILRYKEKFDKAGIRFIYLQQENKGQAAALNQGLSKFSGEYLTWPDADDILDVHNIKKRVEFLESHPEYNVVLCDSAVVDQNHTIIRPYKRIPPKGKDAIFLDLILQRNVYYAGGAYMFRTSTFIECVPSRRIYESRGGQNWQMLLPVLYTNACGYLPEILYYIVEHNDSHSRNLETFQQKVDRTFEHEAILVNTIFGIPAMSEKEKIYYQKIVECRYSRKRFKLAVVEKKKLEAMEYYQILRSRKQARIKERILYASLNNRLLASILSSKIKG